MCDHPGPADDDAARARRSAPGRGPGIACRSRGTARAQAVRARRDRHARRERSARARRRGLPRGTQMGRRRRTKRGARRRPRQRRRGRAAELEGPGADGCRGRTSSSTAPRSRRKRSAQTGSCCTSAASMRSHWRPWTARRPNASLRAAAVATSRSISSRPHRRTLPVRNWRPSTTSTGARRCR